MGDGEWADLKKRKQFDTKYNFKSGAGVVCNQWN